MTLLDHIHDAIKKARGIWKDEISPWLNSFLGSLLHAELEALRPIATAAATELAEDLASGDMGKFATAAAEVLVSTARKAAEAGLQVAGHSLVTAVAIAIGEQPASVQKVTAEDVYPATLDEVAPGTCGR